MAINIDLFFLIVYLETNFKKSTERFIVCTLYILVLLSSKVFYESVYISVALTRVLTRPNPFLNPEDRPDPFEPKNWAQNWVEPKKTGRV